MEDRQKFPYGGPKPVTQQAPIPVVKGSNTLVAPQREFDKRDPKHNFFLIWLLIAVFIGALVFYAGVKYRLSFGEEKQELSLDEVVFASNIDTTGIVYDYTVQPNAEYEIGTFAYIYVKVKGFETKRGEIHLVEDLKVYGPNGKVVDKLDLPKFVELNKATTDGVVEISNKIPLWETLSVGDYKAVVTVKDEIGGKRITKEVRFSLVESEKESISEDVSNLDGELIFTQVRYYDLDGNEIDDLSTYAVTENSGQITVTPKVPDYFPAGDYDVQVVFIGEDGQEHTKTTTFTEKDELYIDNLVFADYVFSDYTHEPQPNAEYEAGDTVYIYFEVKDFVQDGNGRVSFSQDLVVIDPNGEPVYELSIGDIYSVDKIYSETQAMFQVSNTLQTQTNFPKGEYTIAVRVTDKISGQKTKKQGVFVLK